MANTNVFDANKKFVDLSSLEHFWDKAKAFIEGADAVVDGKVTTLAGVVGDANKGLVKDVKSIQDELNSLSGGAGSIATQINNAITALDLPNTYEAKGAAEQALTDAKSYADGKFQVAGNYEIAGTAADLDAAMDARVKVLEGIDHDKLAADAAAAAVATVLDGAPESFDTLKEVAAWIADSESAASAADLVTRVTTLEAIDHEAYKAADTALETSLKGYVDGKVDGKFDAAGAAAQALADAKADAASLYQVKGEYETAGAAATALGEAKSYVDGKVDGKFDAAGAAADAQAAAIAQAKLDAAETLKGYYTKDEVANLLSTNSTADQAYAKAYTDELYNSMKFAANSDIDALFTPKA
jgi:hypothetical protein